MVVVVEVVGVDVVVEDVDVGGTVVVVDGGRVVVVVDGARVVVVGAIVEDGDAVDVVGAGGAPVVVVAEAITDGNVEVEVRANVVVVDDRARVVGLVVDVGDCRGCGDVVVVVDGARPASATVRTSDVAGPLSAGALPLRGFT